MGMCRGGALPGDRISSSLEQGLVILCEMWRWPGSVT